MSTKKTPPLYLVEVQPTEPRRHLVQAYKEGSALAHVAAATISVRRVTPHEAFALAREGVEIEHATQPAWGTTIDETDSAGV